MWEDPVVDEVHRTREKLAAELHFDVKAIFADLRERQASLGEKLVPQKTRAEFKHDEVGDPFPDSTEVAATESAPLA